MSKSGIGLPDDMTPDHAYIQGMADGEQALLKLLRENWRERTIKRGSIMHDVSHTVNEVYIMLNDVERDLGYEVS